MTEEIDSSHLVQSFNTVSISNPVHNDSQHNVPTNSSIPKIVARSFKICDVVTDIWIQIFADRVVYGVSQIGGSIGNYLMCEAVPSEMDPRAVDYNVTTLLGAHNDSLLEVYARRITELIMQNSMPVSSHPTVVLGISLDQNNGRNPKMFNLLIEVMHDMYLQANSDARSQ